MENVLHLTYESGLYDFTEVNSSFDSGLLRVAYTNANRNGSFISKEAFERSMATIYNCPIVCNYNRDNDSIGGHDIELVKNKDGGMRIVNITTPVGVVPESAQTFWETIEEDDGSVHEYLCVNVLLWKRQEAYQKIKRDGITSESMEITVKSGYPDKETGLYIIDDFEFTAFALLGDGVTPCFEGASLEVFSQKQFKAAIQQMMDELKAFSLANTSNQMEDSIDQNLTKGGNDSLEKLDLLAEYGLSEEDLDFDIAELTYEDLKQRLTEKQLDEEACDDGDDNADGGSDDGEDDNPEGGDDPEEENPEGGGTEDEPPENGNPGEDGPTEFALSGEQFKEQLIGALCAVKYIDNSWGEPCEVPRYWYVDYDTEPAEVYCYDCEDDWKLYGFPYSLDGDRVLINFDIKKRKKFCILDFDEGADYVDGAGMAIKEAFSVISAAVNSKMGELKEFQRNTLSKERESEISNLFALFPDLEGNDDFENLKTANSEMTIEAIESKCYEIRGRQQHATFTAIKKPSTRISVEKNKEKDEPYGGLFIKYPPTR